METNKLQTVHDAMIKASDAMNRAVEATSRESTQVSTYSVEPSIKEVASMICKANGTTLSQYLRHCCHILIEDYSGKKIRS